MSHPSQSPMPSRFFVDTLSSRFCKALGLPKDAMTATLDLSADGPPTVTVSVPVSEENLNAIAQIVEDENIMVGGQIALYGRLFADTKEKIKQDLIEVTKMGGPVEFIEEEHF